MYYSIHTNRALHLFTSFVAMTSVIIVILILHVSHRFSDYPRHTSFSLSPTINFDTPRNDSFCDAKLSTQVGRVSGTELNVIGNSSRPHQVHNSTRFNKVIKEYKLRSHRRYLLPVHMFSAGPNFHFESFMRAVKYALSEGREIVEIPFRTHGQTQTEDMKGFKSFTETFDVDKLRELVDIVNITEYNNACNSTVETILMDPFAKTVTGYRTMKEFKENYAHHRRVFASRLKTILPDVDCIPRSSHEVQRSLTMSSEKRCLGIFEPNYIEGIDDSMRNVLYNQSYIYKYLARATYIQEIARKIIRLLCAPDEGSFIAVHWRNTSGEACVQRTQSSEQYNKYCIDNNIKQINYAGKRFSKHLKTLVKKRRIKSVYVAFPAYAKDIMKYLARARLTNIVTWTNVLMKSWPEISAFENDNYVISLIEQEICYRAKLFIGSRSSGWSSIVSLQRNATNKETMFIQDFSDIGMRI